jgi:hypothetical protein
VLVVVPVASTRLPATVEAPWDQLVYFVVEEVEAEVRARPMSRLQAAPAAGELYLQEEGADQEASNSVAVQLVYLNLVEPDPRSLVVELAIQQVLVVVLVALV